MPEKEREKETKPKELTQAEARVALKNELSFYRDITNFVKQMKDNGCINIALENDVKNSVEEQLRNILGLPPKPVAPVYMPPQPAQQQQYQPGQQSSYQPRQY